MNNDEKHKTPLQNLYGIVDDVAGTFFPPFTSQNSGTAIRSFGQMLTDERNGLSKNPQDYRLFLLGSFDPDDGQIQPLASIVLVSQGHEFLKHDNLNTQLADETKN